MERHHKRFFIVAAGIVLGLIAIQSTMFVRPRRAITIEVDGTPGQSVVATFDVDGRRGEESRQLPTTFQFRARHLSFFVVPEEDPHESNLAVKMYMDEKHEYFCQDDRGVKEILPSPACWAWAAQTTALVEFDLMKTPCFDEAA